MARKLGGEPEPAVVDVTRRRSPWPAVHPRVRAASAAMAGPALIVVAVLVVHHRMAFGGYVTDQHIDILPMWLPTHCFLGTSLAQGHIPAWNPHVLAGTPFAADPQSGWTYLPAMALYTVLSCDEAIRAFVVLQPMLAGVGVYGFLRAEEVSRPAATVGGLALALLMAGSFVGLALPFAGTLAWSAVALCALAWALRARSTPVRLLLVVATAVAWGQIANAHLSHGLVVGTLALAAYLVTRVVSPRTTRQDVGRLAGLLAVALPLVNLAVLLPRLAYLPRTTIGLGYPELQRLAGELTGLDPVPFTRGPAADPTWPLWLVASPGSYVGVVALALAFAGLIAGRRRALSVGFTAFGLLCYVLSLSAFAEWVKPLALKLPFGDFYLHEPDRFRYGALLAVCVLAGLGVEAWLAERSPSRRALMAVPGLLVWGVLAAAFGVARPEPWVTVLGLLLGGGALAVVAARRGKPVLAWLVPAALAVEMVAGGLAGQSDEYLLDEGVEKPGEFLAFPPLRRPDVDVAAYLEPGPIATRLQRVTRGERYVTLGEEGITRRGYLPLQDPGFWPAVANQRAMLFGLRDAGGYNPTQLEGYWRFIRSEDPKRLRYNASYLTELTPDARRLLAVGYAVTPGPRPVKGATPVVREGDFVLWRLVPAAELAWWDDPGPLRQRPWNVDVAGPQRIVVSGSPSEPKTLVVAVPHDPNWSATDEDGTALEVISYRGVVLGVRVPPSAQRVTLTYDDPSIGYGLLGSGVAVGGFFAAAAWFAVRERRRRTTPLPPPEADGDGPEEDG